MNAHDLVTDAVTVVGTHLPVWEAGYERDERGNERFATAPLRTSLHTDVAALTVDAEDWSLEATQLCPCRFQAMRHAIPLGPMLISSCACNLPLVVRAAPPAQCGSILLAGAHCATLTVRGQRLSAGECILLGADSTVELLSAAPLDVIAIALSAPAWLATLGSSMHGIQRLSPGLHWTQSVRATIATLHRQLETETAACLAADARADATAALLMRIAELSPLNTADRWQPRRNYRFACVERARRFIHCNLCGPLRISSVCAHTGAQARTLEYGFRALLGVPPVAYIKAMRLNRLHGLLLSLEAEQRTITELALDGGFTHASQFAADYHRFFGESPSTSRRRARGDRYGEAHRSCNGRPSCT